MIMAVAFNNGVIRLDSTPEFVFYAGQVVSGSIQFELDHPLTFSAIYIQFLGAANVSWTETEIQKVGNVRNHRIIKYEGKEEYINHTIHLAGGQEYSRATVWTSLVLLSSEFSQHIAGGIRLGLSVEKREVLSYLLYMDDLKLIVSNKLQLMELLKNASLECTDRLQLLGVEISSDLNFGQFIESKAKIAARKLGVLAKFQIPFTVPSSFKGDQGQISYTMQAHLVTPETVHAHAVIAKDFTVVAPFDLNTGSDRIKEAIQLEFEEMYGCDCFCLTSDPVTIRVRMPVSGYCPGQLIPVSVEVDNGSRVEITKMIFEILSKELYRSQHPASEYIPPEKVMVTLKKGPVMSKSQRKFTVELPVPEFIVPYLENCSIIDVGYFFRITIKLSGCNNELQDEAEICLGQVPVQVFTNGPYVHPLAHSLPTGPIPNPQNTTEFLIPPPTVSIRGSHTSLQRAEYNQSHAYQSNQGPYSNNPPPYPYPSGNVSMEMKARPLQGSDIGFKLPEVVPTGGPGYPTSGPGYPTSGPGYPTSGPGYPTSGPGYPTSGPGYPTSGPGFPTAGPGYPTSGPGYPTSGPGYPTSGPGYPASGPGYPTSAPSDVNPPPYSSIGSKNGAAPYGEGKYAPTAPPPSS